MINLVLFIACVRYSNYVRMDRKEVLRYNAEFKDARDKKRDSNAGLKNA